MTTQLTRPRLRPKAATMPPSTLLLRFILVALSVMALMGCAEADVSNTARDDDATTDLSTTDSDGSSGALDATDDTTDPDPDTTPSDDIADLMTPPPPGLTRAQPSAGGGQRSSGQHRFNISVGAPVITARRRTRSHRIEIGIQPFLQLH